MQKLGQKKGFMLVEVLVSVGILSFALVLILQGFIQSLNAVEIAQNNLDATFLAKELTTQLILEASQSQLDLESQNKGQKRKASLEYNWEIEVFADKDQEGLKKVLSKVNWQSGRRKGETRVYTYLALGLDREDGE